MGKGKKKVGTSKKGDEALLAAIRKAVRSEVREVVRAELKSARQAEAKNAAKAKKVPPGLAAPVAEPFLSQLPPVVPRNLVADKLAAFVPAGLPPTEDCKTD